MTDKDSRWSAFRSDLSAVRSVGFWVTLVVSLLSTAFPTALSMLMQGPQTQMGVGEAGILLNVFKLTAPLTAAVVFITLGFARGWFEDIGPWCPPGIVAGAAMLGNLFVQADQHVKSAEILDLGDSFPWVVIAAGVNYLLGFYLLYGGSLFLSSIVVGVFTGWMLNRLWPHVSGAVTSTIRPSASGSKKNTSRPPKPHFVVEKSPTCDVETKTGEIE